jgi:hypothetical protein
VSSDRVREIVYSHARSGSRQVPKDQLTLPPIWVARKGHALLSSLAWLPFPASLALRRTSPTRGCREAAFGVREESWP